MSFLSINSKDKCERQCHKQRRENKYYATGASSYLSIQCADTRGYGKKNVTKKSYTLGGTWKAWQTLVSLVAVNQSCGERNCKQPEFQVYSGVHEPKELACRPSSYRVSFTQAWLSKPPTAFRLLLHFTKQ